jgi:hypothetical protein
MWFTVRIIHNSVKITIKQRASYNVLNFHRRSIGFHEECSKLVEEVVAE